MLNINRNQKARRVVTGQWAGGRGCGGSLAAKDRARDGCDCYSTETPA